MPPPTGLGKYRRAGYYKDAAPTELSRRDDLSIDTRLQTTFFSVAGRVTRR